MSSCHWPKEMTHTWLCVWGVIVTLVSGGAQPERGPVKVDSRPIWRKVKLRTPQSPQWGVSLQLELYQEQFQTFWRTQTSQASRTSSLRRHTEEKIHFKPFSIFTKKIGQKSSRPFLGVWAVCLLRSLPPFDADADSDTEQPDAVFVTLCVSVWCSLILCDLLGVIVWCLRHSPCVMLMVMLRSSCPQWYKPMNESWRAARSFPRPLPLPY